MNAYVRHSTGLDELRTPNSLSPGLATIVTVKGIRKSALKLFGKKRSRVADADKERDDADSRPLNKCRKEERRIESLKGSETRRIDNKLEGWRKEYERSRI